jgi:hypothetical protein
MDLTDVFREPTQNKSASLIDLSWATDGKGLGRTSQPSVDEIVNNSKNPNNVKPELEVEWGTAGPDIDIDEPAGEVMRNLPEDALGDASEVILFARDLMNRGKMGKDLRAALTAKFAPEKLGNASEGLQELFKLEGLIGCVAVDGRGYESCQEALKAASNSPYKGFIKRVIGCSCGDPHMLPDHREMKATIPECSGNAIDDFFAVETPVETSMLAHCRSTMLPLIGQDIDDSELSSTMVDMMNVTGLPEDDVDKMWKDKHNDKYSSNLDMVQEAFIMLSKMAEKASAKEYTEPVDASEFHIAQADNEIELSSGAMADIDVDPVDPGLQQVFEPDAPAPTNFDGIGQLVSDVGDVPLAGTPDLSDVDVQMTDETDLSKLMFEEKEEAPAPVMVDERPAEMVVDEPVQSPIDVEMTQFQEEEFEGIDEVDLNPKSAPTDELDIEFGGEMEI